MNEAEYVMWFDASEPPGKESAPYVVRHRGKFLCRFADVNRAEAYTKRLNQTYDRMMRVRQR